MPDYAQNLQNPDYAPNYAIMPEHNGEDPNPGGPGTRQIDEDIGLRGPTTALVFSGWC